MIFLSTVMDDEETNTNNSVEHYDDGGLEAAQLFTMTNVQLSTAQGSYRYSLRRVV